MKKSNLPLFLFLLFSFTISTAQVKIKERVTLDPATKINKLTSSQAEYISFNNISFGVRHNKSDKEVSAVGIATCTGETKLIDWHIATSIGMTFAPTRGGNYVFQFRINLEEFETCEAQYVVSYGGEIVAQGVRTLTGQYNSFVYFSLTYHTEEPTNFSLHLLNNTLCLNGSTQIRTSLFNDCNSEIISDNSPIQLSIEESDYISFYNLSINQFVGNSINTTFGDLLSYEIKLLNPYFGNDELLIPIRASAYGNVSRDTVFIPGMNEPRVYAPYEGLTIEHASYAFLDISVNSFGLCGSKNISIPDTTLYNVIIVQGNEYASLYDYNTDNYVDTLLGLTHENGFQTLIFDTLEDDEPIIPQSVILLLETTDPEIAPISLSITVKPSSLLVQYDSAEIAPGDTTNIMLSYINENGDTVEFDEDQQFEIFLWEGFDYGTIHSVSLNENSEYFYNIPGEFKFIAADSIDKDVVNIEIVVSTLVEICSDCGGGGTRNIQAGNSFNKIIARKRKQLIPLKVKDPTLSLKKTSVDTESENQYALISGIGKLKIIKPVVEIMLGETKYFEAYYPDPLKDSLIIHEVQTEIGETPKLEFGIPNDVWGNEPIEVLGEKSGVYWEKKDPNGNDLQTGLIRIIGRFWEEGKDYKALIQAEHDHNRASMAIEVVKPSILDQKPHEISNVFNSTINIDEIIINYAGKYGIPPQYIKGQFKKESNFKPAYRYEPFIDRNYQQNYYNDYFNEDFPYVVDSSSMGEGISIPSSHINVQPPYPSTPTTIGSYLVDNFSSYVNTSKKQILYNSALTRKLRYFVQQQLLEKKDENISTSQALVNAIDSTKGFITSGKAGDEYVNYAQTRIIASYGFVQLTFFNISEWGYKFGGFTKTNENQPPEYINDTGYFFPAYIERLEYFLKKKVIKSTIIPDHSWPGGYEDGWKETIQWHNYNESGYADDVFEYANNYLPKR